MPADQNPTRLVSNRGLNCVFAAALALLPGALGGCADGQMDPNVSSFLSSATGGRLGSGSKEMQQASAFAKMGSAMAPMNDEDARRIGEPVALAIINDSGLITDQKIAEYVTKVGLTVAAVSSKPELNFSFGVLDTDEVNAYSTPGGYVFITRGALAKMQDEAELAGVLAHEVGHVCREHGINAVRRAGFAEGLAQGATASDNRLAQLSPAIDEMVKGYKKAMSPPDENDADKEAVKYLKDAGYDPNGILRFLQRVQADSQSKFATHHPTPERIQKVQALIGPSAGGATLKDRFAANVKLGQ